MTANAAIAISTGSESQARYTAPPRSTANELRRAEFLKLPQRHREDLLNEVLSQPRGRGLRKMGQRDLRESVGQDAPESQRGESDHERQAGAATVIQSRVNHCD